MARITLERLRHSYLANPAADADWALRRIDVEWADGGAYALLGPSGCGKTTLLNVVSGLLRPSRGRVLFDAADVTGLDPADRHVAQVFQFPVIYDTMTVYGNLAFPLRNRGMAAGAVDARVREVAAMLDLDRKLARRASRLGADDKQKISLGRGLVRSDVNVIMFDEPLTVIDPQMKWVLRSKLKEIHRQSGVTMIYVTHDQTEALTFADTVVVMYEGRRRADRHPGRAVRAAEAHLRRAFHRLARHERPAVRDRRRRRDLRRGADPARCLHRPSRAGSGLPGARRAAPSSSASPTTASRWRSRRWTTWDGTGSSISAAAGT